MTRTYDSIRISPHFVLLDFMADHDIYTYGRPLPLERIIKDENLGQVTRLCQNLLEPMMRKYGPLSVAGGFWPSMVRTAQGHHATSPHMWQESKGAAADVVFHDWVNSERSPIELLHDMDRDDEFIYDRAIQYAASEFVCLNVRGMNNRYALYENRYTPGTQRGKYINLGATPSDRKSRRTMRPVLPEVWRRQDGDPIPHTRGRLRAHHIRTGRYFVLLDFCRSSIALTRGVCMVPPVNKVPSQIGFARMFSEVLDPCVAEFGRVTVVRGMEPKGFLTDENAALHRWLPSLTEGRARCVVLLAEGVRSDDAMDIITQHEGVEAVHAFEHASGGELVALTIREFEPAHEWTSWLPLE